MNQTIVSLLKEAVSKYSSHIAVTDGSKGLSYLELDRDSNRISNYLVKKLGDGSQYPIGLYFTQTTQVVAAIVGVLKSGNIYVPLDRKFPESRLNIISEDADLKVIITTSDLKEKAQEISGRLKVVCVAIEEILEDDSNDEEHKVAISVSDHAYILYTSGTTGKPKGIYQSHENVVHHCLQFSSLVRIAPSDVIGLTASFSHSVAVVDIFSVLFSGGCVAVYDIKANSDLLALKAFLKNNKITIFHSIPSLFRSMLAQTSETDDFNAIRLVVLGGEDVHERDFNLFKEKMGLKTVFVNLYGSTELIIATAYLMNKKSILNRSKIPAGYPIEGVSFEILSEDNRNQGVLNTGEIVFKSKYLSSGYKNAALNKTNLVVDQSNPDMRIYRCGDLGRVLADGALELMGRSDTQIKINGNRIELQEIETATDSYPTIEKSIIKAFDRTEFGKYIVCFYKAKEPVDVQHLRDFINKTLPPYMMPERFVEVTEFPSTATGKIDRAAIKIHQSQEFKLDGSFLNETEEQLAGFWKEVLQHSDFAPTDQFLLVGGNSLKLSQLHLKINEVHPDMVSVQDLFDYNSIRALANLINSRLSSSEVDQKIASDIEF
jgi:amino acid adenylation domain-containing protein